MIQNRESRYEGGHQIDQVGRQPPLFDRPHNISTVPTKKFERAVASAWRRPYEKPEKSKTTNSNHDDEKKASLRLRQSKGGRQEQRHQQALLADRDLPTTVS